MTTRFPIAVLMGLALSVSACGGKAKAPAAAPDAQAPIAAPAAAAPQPQAPKPEAAAPAAAPATPTPTPAGQDAEKPVAVDKDKLTKCYQEVYCAQKKGEMDKILGIYKQYGFNTPQEFTKTWIEAAKDTDWVTKTAHEVSKKCQ